MIMTIWKYRVDPTDAFKLDLPEGAKVLDVQLQGDTVQLWALVNPKAEKHARTFRTVATGSCARGSTGSRETM